MGTDQDGRRRAQRLLLVVTVLLLSAGGAPLSAQAIPPEVRAAFTEELPDSAGLVFEPVELAQLPEVLRRHVEASLAGWAEGARFRYAQAHRAALPAGRVLWVAGHEGAMGKAELGAVVSDPARGLVSPTVFQRESTAEHKLAPMLAAFRLDDVDGDGRVELVFRDHQHNGTMHNAGVDQVFALDSDLSLREVLAFTAWRHDLWSERECGFIFGVLRAPDRQTGLMALEFYTSNPEYDDLGTLLGRLQLKWSDEQQAWVVAVQEVRVERYAGFIELEPTRG